jgi:hypothetical protein
MTMLRFYIRLAAIVLIPLFVLLAITMSALGSTQPMHPALRGFVEGCEGAPQPCWYGIVPGRTSRSEVSGLILNADYAATNYGNDPHARGDYQPLTSGNCEVAFGYDPSAGDYLYALHLYSCGFTLDDLLNYIGMPKSVTGAGSNTRLTYNGLVVILDVTAIPQCIMEITIWSREAWMPNPRLPMLALWIYNSRLESVNTEMRWCV